ncbi:excalibur calcium-binding domain-containing protein [Lederbergia citrea]|uniref:excalibur calcium-binding domain-containing protein n=1 Tax=Lederbergia citrea TaxID=2833581 RepID=UPI001BC8ED05|nr:excalibur calcium-binding domain-containing protein [Lederbergia citrea]MBS4178193.1 excalibur calcium-binding domain-containing protein [Lederbergia citrea]MBS4204869.1 excalibur calcium-binding domain-containing protein [Lederbergia citrea]
MKRISIILLAFGLVLGFATSQPTEAEAKTKIVKYKNCTALNKDYKGGVASSAKVKNKGGKTKYKPFVSKALYDANKKLDRDKDSIACER